MATAPDQRIQEAFERAGYTEALVDRWWHLPQSRLGGRTACQAWKTEDYREVEVLALAYAARSGGMRVRAEMARTEIANGSGRRPRVRAREFLDEWRSKQRRQRAG